MPEKFMSMKPENRQKEKVSSPLLISIQAWGGIAVLWKTIRGQMRSLIFKKAEEKSYPQGS